MRPAGAVRGFLVLAIRKSGIDSVSLELLIHHFVKRCEGKWGTQMPKV